MYPSQVLSFTPFICGLPKIRVYISEQCSGSRYTWWQAPGKWGHYQCRYNSKCLTFLLLLLLNAISNNGSCMYHLPVTITISCWCNWYRVKPFLQVSGQLSYCNGGCGVRVCFKECAPLGLGLNRWLASKWQPLLLKQRSMGAWPMTFW